MEQVLEHLEMQIEAYQSLIQKAEIVKASIPEREYRLIDNQQQKIVVYRCCMADLMEVQRVALNNQ